MEHRDFRAEKLFRMILYRWVHIMYRNPTEAERQLLTPVILATWEVEIRRITDQSQPQGDPISKITKQGWRSGSSSGTPT
jgi:hypothetical protein